MYCRYRAVYVFCSALTAALTACLLSSCSPQFHKADADKEVYNIIDGKWQAGFGRKANYTISDSNIPSPNDIQVQNVVPPSGVVALAQAVAIATANNRDYQSRKESLYLSALKLTGTRHKYAMRWFGTIDSQYAKDAEGDDLSIGTGTTGSGDSGIGVKKTQLLGNGIRVSTGLAVEWLRYLTGDPRTSLGSVLSASITIPLLGNRAGKVAQEELTQAERNVLYAIRGFNRYRKTFVVSIVDDYYGVLQQRDAVTNAENNYKRRQEFSKQAKMETRTGRTSPFEVDQAKQRELDAYDSYVSAVQKYELALDRFKLKLALHTDANVELDQKELEALQQTGVSEPNYTSQVAVETALQRRLDLATSADKIDDAVRNAVLSAEGLGTQLDIVASTNVSSREETNFTQLQFNEGLYELGLDSDLPLDRKLQRNAYREALIALEQQRRTHNNDIDTVVLEVRQAHRQLKATAEQYITQEKALMLAEERVKNMPVLLKSGRAKTRDLLEAQDALLAAQNQLTGALIRHAVANLSFYRDVGILDVKPDGMWAGYAKTDSRQGEKRHGLAIPGNSEIQ